MAKINIYMNNFPGRAITITYHHGNETLESIIEQVEPKIVSNPSLFHVAVGYDVFYDLNIPIETCLVYGDSILLYQLNEPQYMIYCQNETTRYSFPIHINSFDLLEKVKKSIYNYGKSILFSSVISNNADITLFYSRQTLDSTKTLDDYKIPNRAMLQYRFNFQDDFSAIENSIEKRESYHFISKIPGLYFEGKCQNKLCDSYNKTVFINLGVPVIYHLNSSNSKRTFCSTCDTFIQPEKFIINNCEWRYLGVKKQFSENAYTN